MEQAHERLLCQACSYAVCVQGMGGVCTFSLEDGQAVVCQCDGWKSNNGSGIVLQWLKRVGLCGRSWTLMHDTPAIWTRVEHPLPSDSRFRPDLQALKEGDLFKAQVGILKA